MNNKPVELYLIGGAAGFLSGVFDAHIEFI